MLSQSFVRSVVALSTSVKPGIQVAAGRKVSDSGKESIVYATFWLNPLATVHSWEEALAYLDNGNGPVVAGKVNAVKVSLPREQDVTIRLSLSPVMTPENAAKVIRQLAGLSDAATEPVKSKGKGNRILPATEPATV